MKTGLSIVAAVLAVALGAPAAASAEVVLHEDFESNAPGWTQSGLWHVKNNPQTVSVVSAIHPTLVTLPDSGQLPSAVSGTHAAWYGEDSSGTFCTGYTSVTQSAKNGCESASPNTGRLVSPSFSLVGATTAQVAFNAWWEIEAVNADNFDLIKVEYSTDGGTTWHAVGKLNPVNNPAGKHFETYSNNGLAVSPSWHTYVASLSAAAGQANVRVGFTFDTVDSLYQGFRGLLIDDVDVATPFAADTPQIGGVDPTCVSSTATNQVVAVTGTNFALGSKLFLDGSEVSGAATLSSQRMEFKVSNLAAGSHTIRIVGPLGATSNVATLTSAANCAAQPVAPPAPDGGHGANDLRPTATQVMCNRGPNPGDPSVCTATVGDAAGPPRPNPTGAVVFTTTTGSFPMGDRCTLTPTSMSPGVASCAATYYPAAGSGFPEVTASYQGSDVHAPSQGATSFIIAAPPSTTEPFDPESNCPDPLAGLPRTAAPKAKAAIEREAAHVPEHERGLGYCLWYGSAKLFRYTVTTVADGVVVTVGVVAGVGAPLGGGALGLEAGPVGGVIGFGTGAAITKEYVYPATTGTLTALNDAHKRAIQDPPDPSFKVVVKPAPVKVKRLAARKGLNRRTARAVTRLVRAQIRVRNLSRAISATIDKAGGAKEAGDEKWVGVQTRATIKYSKRLARSLDRLTARQQAAAGLAKKSPVLSKPMVSAKKLAERLQRKAQRGFTKRELRLLRAQGMSDEEIAALRESLRTLDPKTVPRSVAGLIADPALTAVYEIAPRAWRAYVKVPSVLADAALPGSTASSSGPSVASSRLAVSNGRIAVAIACGATATPPCTGKVRIRKGKRTLGRQAFRLDEETLTTVSVKLSQRGRRVLGRGGRHKVTVVVVPAEGERVARRFVVRR